MLTATTKQRQGKISGLNERCRKKVCKICLCSSAFLGSEELNTAGFRNIHETPGPLQPEVTSTGM